MPRKEHHVVPNSDGGWDIKKNNAQRPSNHFDNKSDAISKAREISKNQNSELIIHNQDGKISKADSHGKDPFPPRDKK